MIQANNSFKRSRGDGPASAKGESVKALRRGLVDVDEIEHKQEPLVGESLDIADASLFRSEGFALEFYEECELEDASELFDEESASVDGEGPELFESETSVSDEIDPIRLYLTEIGRFPLLSRQEEQEVAADITYWGARLQKTLFMSDFVALKAVTFIRAILESLKEHEAPSTDRRERLDQYFTFKRDKSDGKGGCKGVEQRLSAAVETIERLLGTIQDAVPRLYDTSRTSGQWLEDAQKTVRARGKISRLLTETGMRRSVVKQLEREFLAAAKNPSSFWKKEGVNMVQEMRKRLGLHSLAPVKPAHLVLFGEDDNRLARRVERVTMSDTRYEKARTTLYQRNLRLVVSIAKNWAANSADLLDQIQNGNEGLAGAVDAFDHTLGYKFSTFATGRILARIRKEKFENVSGVRRKVSSAGLIDKVRQAQQEFSQKHGRDGDEYDLAEATGMSIKDARVGLALALPNRSLDAPLGGFGKGEATTGGALLVAREEESVADAFDKAWLRELTHPSAKILLERESLVIKLRFGLFLLEEHEEYSKKYQVDTREGLTLAQVGNILKVTRERVRQIETKALKKLHWVLQQRPGRREL